MPKWRGITNNNFNWSHSLTVFRRGFSPIYSITTDVSTNIKLNLVKSDFHKNRFFHLICFRVSGASRGHTEQHRINFSISLSLSRSLSFSLTFSGRIFTCVGQRSTHSIAAAAEKIIELKAPHISSTYHHNHGYNIGQISGEYRPISSNSSILRMKSSMTNRANGKIDRKRRKKRVFTYSPAQLKRVSVFRVFTLAVCIS